MKWTLKEEYTLFDHLTLSAASNSSIRICWAKSCSPCCWHVWLTSWSCTSDKLHFFSWKNVHVTRTKTSYSFILNIAKRNSIALFWCYMQSLIISLLKSFQKHQKSVNYHANETMFSLKYVSITRQTEIFHRKSVSWTYMIGKAYSFQPYHE